MRRVRAGKPRRASALDPAYLRFIRSLPCCACGRRAPSHAHHEIGGGRGKGQKAPDRRTLPLCSQCHADFHALAGSFCDYTLAMKRELQELEIDRCAELFAAAH